MESDEFADEVRFCEIVTEYLDCLFQVAFQAKSTDYTIIQGNYDENQEIFSKEEIFLSKLMIFRTLAFFLLENIEMKAIDEEISLLFLANFCL